MKKLSLYISLLCLILTAGACKNKTGGPATASSELTDDALMDTVQRRTFLYFWEGAEPNSGLAPERYHVDGVYPQNDANVVTSGGSGFGIMAILAGIDRGYVTREEGLARMERIVSFLEKADRFHGAYPHWWYGDTGKVKPFGLKGRRGSAGVPGRRVTLSFFKRTKLSAAILRAASRCAFVKISRAGRFKSQYL